VAYFTSVETIDTDQLRRDLLTKLPIYMIPGHFIELKVFQKTRSDKIDLQALPTPAVMPDNLIYATPQTDLEKRLAEIWQSVLEIDRIGLHDNFFAIGGHSLIAIRLLSRINSALSINLPLRTIFENPTLKLHTQIIDNRLWLTELDEHSNIHDSDKALAEEGEI